MGGNALQNTRTRRYCADEYFELKDKVIEAIRPLFPVARIEYVKAFRDKSDFGDLDILVEDLYSGERSEEELEDALLQLGVSEVVINDSVWSLGWDDFQVDLLFQPSIHYDFASHYFAYNDLGNLIGRIARRFDLRFGHDGLWYMLLDGDYKIADINLTRDFSTAIEFLGYSYERYSKGFDTLEEIFQFVTTSPYYNHEVFLLQNRNHKARTRDAKRSSYRAFLEYASKHDSQQNIEPISKEEALTLARNFFPDFSTKIDQAWNDHNTWLEAKKKLNGKVISEITGLSGIPLGLFIDSLNSSFSEKPLESLDQWVVKSDMETIREKIKLEFNKFSKKMKKQVNHERTFP